MPAGSRIKENAADIGKRLLSVVLLGGLALVAIGTLLQFVLLDEVPFLATIFYAFPPQVSAPLLLTAGVFWFRRKRPGIGALHVLGAAGLVAMVVFIDWQPARSEGAEASSQEPQLQVMTWNLWGGRLGAERIGKTILEHNPDIVGVVEAGPFAEDPQLLGAHLPEYRVIPFPGNALLLVRGSVAGKPRFTKIGDRRRISQAVVSANGIDVGVLIVDLHWGFWENRAPVFKELQGALTEFRGRHPQLPVVVMGDFNTPRRSRLLDTFRGDLLNTFTASGVGLGLTWPAQAPLWDLDQIWVDRGWQVHSCVTPATLASDHRPVVARLSR